ncbi:hypothetical protein BC940DRAFT_2586 [Gongronella butleri]|nr:hypothetical protein BC940DRAFT_2586 [Gongronella butleri]
MSSPPDSIHSVQDIDDPSSKKRGRAQSVEPQNTQKDEEVDIDAKAAAKRDELPNSNSMTTIRKNLKDMTTTDKQEHAVDETMHSTQETESDEDERPKQATAGFAQFGANSTSDDWGEFADDDDQEPAKPVADESKQKYTFGSSSGFGTRALIDASASASSSAAATPAPAPAAPTTQKTVFGGFTSSTSGFGSFATSNSASPFAASPALTTSAPVSEPTTTSSTTSGFGAFASGTSSPFALAAAGSNALSSLPKASPLAALSPTESHASSAADDAQSQEDENERDNDITSPTDDQHAFGEGAKIKVPGVKQQTDVKTGEEDEDTIYHTKAKLLMLDSKTKNWKECGTGTLRVNRKKHTRQTRLVMRADSVFRLILNQLLFAEMKAKIMQDRFVQFSAFQTTDDGSQPKLVSYALKLPNHMVAQELLDHITSHIPHKSSNS